ncbi:MAG: hypothetical protein IT353_04575 [Gemmatimonadaceae bacterium]|nr:hypothetical protein [Gemmatimonadaceae bacterium]
MTKIRLSLLRLSLLCFAAACETGSSSNPETSTGSIVAVSASMSTVVLNAGATITVPVTVERSSGFTRSVELSLSGVPSGVTYTFAPASLAFGQTASTLTLASTEGVQPGSYPLVVRASASDVEPKTAPLSMTVPTPDVTLTFGAGAASVRLEDSVSIPITVTRTGGGFVDPIALGISNLPTGITASFAPSVLTGTNTASVLTLSPALEATVGASTLQVTTSGISAPLKLTPLPLTVLDAAAPTFRIRLASSSAVVPFGGGTSEGTVRIPRGGGLTAPVTLSTAPLPSGVVAEFIPPVVTGTGTTSTIRFTSTAAATPGTYPVTVRGTASGLEERTIASLLTVTGVRLFPATATVQRGGTAQIPLSISRYGTLTDAVTVAVSGGSAGFTFTGLPFSLAASSGGALFSAGVAVDQSVAPGVYTINIEARGQSQLFSASTITITVTN